MNKLRYVKPDARLNPNAYPDIGCGGLCVHALECPYPICLQELPVPERPFIKSIRNRNLAIARMKTAGIPGGQIAKATSVSIRTVYRIPRT